MENRSDQKDWSPRLWFLVAKLSQREAGLGANTFFRSFRFRWCDQGSSLFVGKKVNCCLGNKAKYVFLDSICNNWVVLYLSWRFLIGFFCLFVFCHAILQEGSIKYHGRADLLWVRVWLQQRYYLLVEGFAGSNYAMVSPCTDVPTFHTTQKSPLLFINA